jgi:hypothetical protein
MTAAAANKNPNPFLKEGCGVSLEIAQANALRRNFFCLYRTPRLKVSDDPA